MVEEYVRDGRFARWMKAALIRAVRTFAQAALAALGTGAAGLFDVQWTNVLSIAALAAVVSLLMSTAGLPEIDGEAPDGGVEE